MQTVALIDYGSGNLRSAERALVEAGRRSGVQSEILVTDDPEVVRGADRIVLPGVGAFGASMAGLGARRGLLEAMEEAVQGRGAPFLGVCVGMQLLAERGHEFGDHAGLGWISGEVRRLEPADPSLSVPHMGWNAVETTRPHPLLAQRCSMYFANSYALTPAEPQAVAAVSDHGGPFVAAVARDNIVGVQFHPEKSQSAGLELLGRFLAWRP
ncbi:MAG: imidazole glycerol phosphate synthase subunit HisH [Pseudomonadota bacterium]|nr:imidazole glycerol phosphate synthase subunit HisH [Pseudomonadota bacterium]